MSIKIYNGYQMKSDNMTIFEFKELLDSISIEMKKVFRDIYMKKISKLVYTCLDFKKTFKNGDDMIKEYFELECDYTIPKGPNKLGMCIYRLIELHSHSNFKNNGIFDFNCELELFPLKDKTLFLLRTEKNEYKDILGYIDDKLVEHNSNLFPNISPYIYYDNSDAPNNLKNEWPHREEDWKKALYESQSLSYQLVESTFLNIDYTLINENIEKAYDERITNLSYIKTYDEFKDIINSLSFDNNGNKSFRKIQKATNQVESSDKFKSRLEEIKNELYAIIPKNYEISNLDEIKIM